MLICIQDGGLTHNADAPSLQSNAVICVAGSYQCELDREAFGTITSCNVICNCHHETPANVH